MDIVTRNFQDRLNAAADAFARDTVEANIALGARILVEEPQRVRRIIRGADYMTYDRLCAEVARRRSLPPPRDFNDLLALRQLERALRKDSFADVWERYAADAKGKIAAE